MQDNIVLKCGENLSDIPNESPVNGELPTGECRLESFDPRENLSQGLIDRLLRHRHPSRCLKCEAFLILLGRLR